MLSSSPKFSDLIKKNIFKLNLAQNDEKVAQKYFSADFRSFWDSLSRSVQKACQKEALLCIKISTSFGVNHFRNTALMGLILFSEHSKFHVDPKMFSKIIQKVYHFSDNLF